MHAEFAITAWAGSRDDAHVLRDARRFGAPPLVINPVHPATANQSGHAARVRDIGIDVAKYNLTGKHGFAAHGVAIDGNVLLSACKSADDGTDDLILRLFNPSDRPSAFSIWVGEWCTSSIAVRLDEMPDESVDSLDNVLSGEIGSFGIYSVRLVAATR
jgi:alpha-mannosidase